MTRWSAYSSGVLRTFIYIFASLRQQSMKNVNQSHIESIRTTFNTRGSRVNAS